MQKYYRVEHTRCAVRVEPSLSAQICGMKMHGEEVAGALLNGEGGAWLQLSSNEYMLIDGHAKGLGQLLVPVSRSQPTPSKEESRPAKPQPEARPKAQPRHLGPPLHWQVVHRPRVVLRREPSATGAVCGSLAVDSVLRAAPLANGWVHVMEQADEAKGSTGDSFALIDGRGLGFGVLLRALEGADVRRLFSTLP